MYLFTSHQLHQDRVLARLFVLYSSCLSLFFLSRPSMYCTAAGCLLPAGSGWVALWHCCMDFTTLELLMMIVKDGFHCISIGLLYMAVLS
jgi:hypothetical protein